MSRIDTATLRQATEDVRDFGVVVSEADADRIERANAAISRLGLIWRGLSNQLAAAAAPALEAVANAMAALARTTGPLGIAIRGLFDNLGRLASYAATFAGIMAGRWVAGLVAAAVSVRGLATALVALRGALVRTGIGALIVGAGELVYQFGRLVAGAGGFGEALSLLGDVAAEVWERIKLGGRSLALALQSVWATIEAGWLTALSGIQRGWADFLHAATRAAGSVPGMESTMLRLSEAAIRAGSAFYQTAAAAGEASARADELAASAAAAAAGAAAAPLESLQALRDAVAGSGESAGMAPLGGTGSSGEPLRGVDAALDTARKAAGGAAEAIDAVDDKAAELAATLQRDVAQGLGSLFAGLITGATTLKDAVGSVIARLGELALTRGFETLLAGVGFGSGPLGRVASLLLPPTPRAAGGPVAAGLPYLVGERGPELIVPRAPGMVIPNHRLSAGQRTSVGDPRHRHRRPRQCRDSPDGRGRRRAGAARLRRAALRPGGADRRRSSFPGVSFHGHRLPAGAVALRRPAEDRGLPLAAAALCRELGHRTRPGHCQRDRATPLARRSGARPHAACRSRRHPGADRCARTVRYLLPAQPGPARAPRRSSRRGDRRPLGRGQCRRRRQQVAAARQAAGRLPAAPRRHAALRLWQLSRPGGRCIASSRMPPPTVPESAASSRCGRS